MSLSYCPRCRQDFDTPDQLVCGHCGYRLGGRDPALGADSLRREEGRPTGVTLLALLYGTGGCLGLVGGVALMLIPDARLDSADRLTGVVGTATGIALLAFALGAWRLKPWARVLGIILIAAGMAENVIVDVVEAEALGAVIGLVIGGLMIWYLQQPHVKEAFGVTGDMRSVEPPASDRP